MSAEAGIVCVSALAGATVGCVFACIPGLHVYNVMGVALVVAQGATLPSVVVFPCVVGLLVGYALLNSIPSVLLAAPDESAFFTVLPGQAYVMQGRGQEAVLLTLIGGLVGLAVLVCGVMPVAPVVLPSVQRVLGRHMHWILWCVIAFMLMSEWPKGGSTGQGGWRRLGAAWGSLGMGLLTFGLSGLLGFALRWRSPISVEIAFQNLMPAFVGLFTLPWLVTNLCSGATWPRQRITSPKLDPGCVLQGSFAGILGGGFAAFIPGVTGGVGGLLAGHATSIRDDRMFLVSQGASKLVYYAGGFLFLFVPGLNITRGGAAGMVRGVCVPFRTHEYTMVAAALLLAGAVACVLVRPLTRAVIAIVERVGIRRVSAATLVLVVGIVGGLTGVAGVGVMLVGAGVGLLPVLYGARRMNCLGIILLPLACG